MYVADLIRSARDTLRPVCSERACGWMLDWKVTVKLNEATAFRRGSLSKRILLRAHVGSFNEATAFRRGSRNVQLRIRGHLTLLQ